MYTPEFIAESLDIELKYVLITIERLEGLNAFSKGQDSFSTNDMVAIVVSMNRKPRHVLDRTS